MKMLINIIIMLTAFLVQPAIAEEHPYVPFEANPLSIRLSDDGTGIVKNIYCWMCDYKIVNVTVNTKAYEDGIEVPVLKARERNGKWALVAFDPYTREVQTIRWSKPKQ